MTTINIPTEKVLFACQVEIESLDNTIKINQKYYQSSSRLEGTEFQETAQQTISRLEKEKESIKSIQSRVSQGHSLTESDFNLIKRYL